MTASDRPSPWSPQAQEDLRAAMGVYVSHVAGVFQQIKVAFQPLLDQVEAHPELLEQWLLEREAEERLSTCHCLCGAVHRSRMGVCDGAAEAGLTVTFHSQTVGTQHVAFCRNCYDARQAELAVGAGV